MMRGLDYGHPSREERTSAFLGPNGSNRGFIEFITFVSTSYNSRDLSVARCDGFGTTAVSYDRCRVYGKQRSPATSWRGVTA